jgi:hypothetical protein
MEGDKKEESKRGAASNIMGSFRGAPAPLSSLPPLLLKERGIKGVRLKTISRRRLSSSP